MSTRFLACTILIILLAGIADAAVDNISTVSLLHFDNATDSGTYFKDEFSSSRVWASNNGSVTATNSSKFGASGLFINGMPSRYITATTSSEFNYGTGNFTEEMWVNMTSYSAATGVIVTHNNTISNASYFAISSVGALAYAFYENGIVMIAITGSAYQVPLNQPTHIAVIRNADTFSLYINGTLTAAATYTGLVPSDMTGMTVGGARTVASYSFPGKIDEFRASNVSIWKENFTPPDYAYGSLIQSNFNASKLTPQLGESITFMQNLTGNTSTYNWSFGDGFYSEIASPSHAYTTQGLKTVNLTVSNYALTSANTSTRTNYINVTNATGYNEQNIWMDGQWTNTILITDEDTGAAIPSVTVLSSSGKSTSTTNGTAFITEPSGVYVFYYSATGYVSKSVSVVVDGDQTLQVQMTPATSSLPITIPGTPKDVKFHIQSFWGAPISGANVSVQGITTTTGSWDWLAELLSLDFGATPINGTEMHGFTDSNGDTVFLMVDTIKYNISVAASGYTFPLTIISPQASQYTISANMNTTWFGGKNDTVKDINVTVSWVRMNSTHAFVNITYADATGTTTGGTADIYKDVSGGAANASPIASMDITSSSCSNSTLIPIPTGGSSYRAVINTTTADQAILRTFTHYFKGPPVMLPGFTGETLLWLSLFIVIFTAAFAGAIHAPQIAIVICVESWVFWSIGWLDVMISIYGYGETVVLGYLILASFITVWWNVAEGKAKGKRSS